MTAIPKSTVIALYRASLRESHKLFDPVARQAFTNHIRNRFRRNIRVADEGLRYRKIKTAKSRLRHLQAANVGTKSGVAWAFRFAYGASGPLHQFNLKSLKDLSGPHDQSKLPKPPPFHPALHALLSYQHARTKHSSKALPNGPASVSHALEQRGWLGALPQRREKNIWWKWWRAEPSKIHVPAEVKVTMDANSRLLPEQDRQISSLPGRGLDTISLVQALGLPVPKSQGLGLTHRVEQYVSNRTLPNPPRRSPGGALRTVASSGFWSSASTISPQTRFFRRRYRDILSRMPILSFKPAQDPQPPTTSGNPDPSALIGKTTASGKYTVQISPVAATRGNPRHRATYSVMSDEDRQWIQRAQELPKQVNSKHRGASTDFHD